MEQVAGANVKSLGVGSSQGFGAAQAIRPVQWLVEQEYLFIQIVFELSKNLSALALTQQFFADTGSDSVAKFEPVPRRERQRFRLAPHIADGFGTAFGFTNVQANQEAGVGVGFQKADLICSVSLAAAEVLMARLPKTFLNRALKSGIVTFAPFFRAAGTRSQATVRPRLVTSTSSPE